VTERQENFLIPKIDGLVLCIPNWKITRDIPFLLTHRTEDFITGSRVMNKILTGHFMHFWRVIRTSG
jgi:hypothetical protein